MITSPEKTCLVCDAIADGSRGLCVKHYEQFRRKRESFATSEQQSAFEQHLIKLGKLLPKMQGKKLSGQEDVFAEDYQSFLALQSKVAEPDTDYKRIADDAEKVADRHNRKTATKKLATEPQIKKTKKKPS